MFVGPLVLIHHCFVVAQFRLLRGFSSSFSSPLYPIDYELPRLSAFLRWDFGNWRLRPPFSVVFSVFLFFRVLVLVSSGGVLETLIPPFGMIAGTCYRGS